MHAGCLYKEHNKKQRSTALFFYMHKYIRESGIKTFNNEDVRKLGRDLHRHVEVTRHLLKFKLVQC